MTRFRSHRHLPQIMHRIRFTKELPQDLRSIIARRRFKPLSVQADTRGAKPLLEPQRTDDDDDTATSNNNIPDSTLSNFPHGVPSGQGSTSRLGSRLVAVDTPTPPNRSSETLITIPKPAGEAGRPNAGGYSLEIKLKELGWRSDEIEQMQKLLKSLCNVHLDTTLPYSEQDPDLKNIVVQKVKLTFPVLEAYSNTWPVTEMMKSVLKAARDKSKREKVQKAASANLQDITSPSSTSKSRRHRTHPSCLARSTSATLSEESSEL
ncbi:hypothetical protein SISNIDRAFT_485199 [Sistotremastrum niveocremeum HHB9708]|uniref:Uncharacterized protein n=1 Tax=Sistotremastrum niveocremeum HHB9708 TaxID=1314777 RepID=A0A164VMC3_9AGAM|nr:hypothetical protein SISNIDRAFT_485199 [Sistotremastrum niveocremeum HHB9708]